MHDLGVPLSQWKPQKNIPNTSRQITRRFPTPGTDKRQENSTALWGRHAEIPRGSLRRIFWGQKSMAFTLKIGRNPRSLPWKLAEIHGFYPENWILVVKNPAFHVFSASKAGFILQTLPEKQPWTTDGWSGSRLKFWTGWDPKLSMFRAEREILSVYESSPSSGWILAFPPRNFRT